MLFYCPGANAPQQKYFITQNKIGQVVLPDLFILSLVYSLSLYEICAAHTAAGARLGSELAAVMGVAG